MQKFLAGIVLYNADIQRLYTEIKSILFQVELVVLCDNGSTNIYDIEKIIRKFENIVLLKNEHNLGIGVASNQILKYAYENKYDWVLLLDHDTICPSNIIREYSKYIGNDSIGMICPKVVDKEIVNNNIYGSSEKNIEYINRCIQSATFVKTVAWRQSNGFNEWMFIDFVDFDFCKRLEINGYKILRCNTVTVDHQLGKRERTSNADFFNKLYKLTNFRGFKYFTYKNVYSKARVFYCTRNNIVYIKTYKDTINIAKEWKDFFSRIVRRIIRSKNKWMIFKETIKGIVAGIKFDDNNIINGK